MHRWRDWLYPQLSAFPPETREAVLERARRTPFDVIELVGIALGLVLATAVTRMGAAPGSAIERLGEFALDFALALALLAAVVGPFLVRRVRRGLDQERSRR